MILNINFFKEKLSPLFMGKIKLDQIILSGQIEKNYNYNEYLDSLKRGIDFISELEPFKIAEKLSEKYGSIKPELRQIYSRIINKNIIYGVIDEARIEGIMINLRAKGYLQEIGKKKIEEVPERNLEKLFSHLGLDFKDSLILNTNS